MSEAVGSYTCPICGLDEPHYHEPEQVFAERFARPAFEAWYERAMQNQEQGWPLREPLEGMSRYRHGVHGYTVLSIPFPRPWDWKHRDANIWGRLHGEYREPVVEAFWQCWRTAWLCPPDRPQDEAREAGQ